MFSFSTNVRATVRARFEFRKSMRGPQSETVTDADADLLTGTLYVVIYIGKRQCKPFATGISTDRATWDNSRSARPNAEGKKLSRDLMAYEHMVEQEYAKLADENKVVNGEMMADAIRRIVFGDGKAVTLAKIYREFMRAKSAQIETSINHRNDESISPQTYYTYEKRWALIHGYLQANKQLEVPVANVDYPFAVRFKEWLREQRTLSGQPYQSATINKAVSMLKQLMVYALSKGHIKHNTLSDFSCRGGSPANPKPLTSAHLDHLENCELPLRLRQFCDAWLVAGELCLHYADFMELKACVFIKHGDNQFLQRKRRKQQGSSLTQTVDVTPRAERILARNGGVKNLAYTSSAYFSKVLKQIAAKADLRDEFGNLIDLQFGMGRDTGLTQRAIDGANSIQLCKMAGWSKPVYAERYIGGTGAIDIVAAFAESRKGVSRA